jgi:hypothetical protein
MSQIYVSAVVAILAQLFPYIGVTVGSEELTQAITTFITVMAALWVMIRRIQQGDINAFGSHDYDR